MRTPPPRAHLEIQGRAIAPGIACGPLRRNRPELDPKEAAAAILVAERAVPDDVGRILASAGTLTISGTVLSHVSLLSREFGKPSVALSGVTPSHLARDGEPGLLVLDDIVGGGAGAVLHEGDIVVVDGSRGVVGIPGGLDPEARGSVRALYGPLVAFGRMPGDDALLGRVVASARAASDAAFAFLLDAALAYRLVPAGADARRLLQALEQAPMRAEMPDLLEALRERVLDVAADRCQAARASLDDVDDLEELQRAMRVLEGALERDLLLLEDLGGDPDRLERDLEDVLLAAGARREVLEAHIRRDVLHAITLTDEVLRTRLGGLFRLLRRARTAGIGSEAVDRLHGRLSRQLAEERARAGTHLVVPLRSGVRSERALVGGKAAALIEILDALPARCRIPDGFVVTAASYRLHLLGEIGEKLRLAAEGTDDAAISRRARAALLAGEIPAEVRDAIAGAFRTLGAERLAVRSSATIEDGPIGSLAGLFDTYLGVRGAHDLCDRIRWIWASLWNARALAALGATGLSPLRAGQAVLVQEMVDTVSAGVLFSRDPEGRPDTFLVNATWGLGEGISQGEVSGDLFWVRKSTGDLLASDAGAATTRIALDPDGMGTVEVPLEPELRQRRSLDAGQLARLASLARTLEDVTGRAQDVEFGFDASDTLVVFQMRRIVPRRVD
jgi:pyruvate,water dikinase